MNHVFKTIYNYLNKTCMAVPETARSRRSSGSSAVSIGSVLITLASLAAPAAQAAYYVDGSMFISSPTGISCARPGNAGTWSCEIPNGNGGFATISGITAAGADDAVTAAETWAATNLGVNAIALGAGTGTQASGANAVAIGSGAQGSTYNTVAVGHSARANGDSATALGAAAQASHRDSVALGAGSIADGSTLADEAYSPTGNLADIAGIWPRSEVSVGSTNPENPIERRTRT